MARTSGWPLRRHAGLLESGPCVMDVPCSTQGAGGAGGGEGGGAGGGGLGGGAGGGLGVGGGGGGGVGGAGGGGLRGGGRSPVTEQASECGSSASLGFA